MNAKASKTYGSTTSIDTGASVTLLAAAILVALSGGFARLMEDHSPAVQTTAQAQHTASRA
jgi:hypothetical protein